MASSLLVSPGCKSIMALPCCVAQLSLLARPYSHGGHWVIRRQLRQSHANARKAKLHEIKLCTLEERQICLRNARPARSHRAAVSCSAAAPVSESVATDSDMAFAWESMEGIAGIPRHEWPKLQKPARYLGNEFGAVHKPWGDASVRFCLTYPEVYEVGASNLGHILLYTILNQTQGLLCDRTYMPGDDMRAVLKKYSVDLFAVESKRSLADFDILGFSLSYELGATNILEMMHLSGIPVTRHERMAADPAGYSRPGAADPSQGRRETLPFIFAGGPTATSNPEAYSDFFDFFALGDGEELLPEIGRCLQRCKAEGLTREETLFQLASTVRGCYVPMFYDMLEGWGGAVFPNREGVPERVVRRVAQPDPFTQIGLVPFTATVHDRLTIEIRRGCTRGCRFCQPGMLTRPARDVDPDDVVRAVEEGMRKTGYNEFSLLSLSCSDYLALPSVGLEIKNRLKGENISLSLPSQRVDRFDDSIANILGGRKKGSLTFAPEAGTQRLRDIINKGLTNEELLRGVKTAWSRGWKQVKLYFMIGLPGETDEDVVGIVDTVKWLQRECRRGRTMLSVNLTISNFTPKPHTPFQWHSVSSSEFVRKQQLLRGLFREMRHVKVNYTSAEMSAMEDFMGRADRRLGKVIRRAWELGATNDAWYMNVDGCFKAWNAAIEEAGMGWKYRQVLDGEWDVMDRLGDARYRGQGGGGKGRIDRGELADTRLDAPLPWDVVDTGITKWWLKTDLQKALEAITVPDCSHSGLCSECGVCGDEFGDNVVAEVPPLPEFEGHFKPDQRRAQRIRVTFAKRGTMAYIGHLDLATLFERAMRRAALPVSYDNGFHSRPRISVALALPLGYTSSCEYMDVEMMEKLPLADFRSRLAAQLPADLPLVGVEEVPLKRPDGKYTETTSKLLSSAEYTIFVECVSMTPAAKGGAITGDDAEEAAEGRKGEEEDNEDEGEPDEEDVAAVRAAVEGITMAAPSGLLAGAAKDAPPLVQPSESEYATWVRDILALEMFIVPRVTKRGRNKEVDLRPSLLKLELVRGHVASPAARAGLSQGGVTGDSNAASMATIRFVGHLGPDGTNLAPEGLLGMLNQVSGRTFALVHAHREHLNLEPASVPKVDVSMLRSLALRDTFAALVRMYPEQHANDAMATS
eukprot:jgi/Mesvir1/7488/Mv19249-RA.1